MLTEEKISEIVQYIKSLEPLNLKQHQLICLAAVLFTFVPDDKLQEVIQLNTEFVDYINKQDV